MQFLQAVDWMHTLLPKMAEVVAPLRDLLEKVLDVGRFKRVAKNKSITEEHWTLEQRESWDAALDILRDATKLVYPKRGWKVLMFPGTRDFFWSSFLTQVSPADIANKKPMEAWHHEPLGFLSRLDKGSQLRCPTVDKEGFAIVSTLQRLEYLMWGGVHIYCDHRNMAYTSAEEALLPDLSKATTQRRCTGGRTWGNSTIRSCTSWDRETAGGTCCHGGGICGGRLMMRCRNRRSWCRRKRGLRRYMPVLMLITPCRRRAGQSIGAGGGTDVCAHHVCIGDTR